jgi:hypothetical protein
MSQVVIAGDTSGTITLQAPAVSGSSVLTLPATTATLATLTTPSFASTIGVGGTTAANSGAGISFPATQSASSDANTLDDYEEGTWTPTFTGSISNPTVTYGTQLGQYTKVGRQVTCTGRISISSASGGSGQTRISGLPFANGSSQMGFFAMQQNNGTGASAILVSSYLDGNITYLQLWANQPQNGFATYNLPLSGGIDFIYTFSYFI